MKPADLETVQRMFAIVAPTAAAEMKSRVLAVLREMRPLYANAQGKLVVDVAIETIELLPLSKEATT